MKLYVVTAGCYSNYHICGIFESEEKAKLYIELHSKDPNGCLDEDMEYYCTETLDDRLRTVDDTRKLYFVCINPNTGKTLVNEKRNDHLIPEPNDTKIHEYSVWDWNERRNVTTYGVYILTNDENHALKIALDKYDEYKAEKAGII